MGMLTQGSQIFFIDLDSNEVVEVECATSFNPGGNPADQLEATCLADSDASYEPGLRRPGVATLGANLDDQNESHVRMYELSQSNPSPTLKWVVGFSNGTDVPTAAADSSGEYDFVLSEDRGWFSFDGYISDFPFDLALNSFVTGQISIQRSGPSQWIPKVVSS